MIYVVQVCSQNKEKSEYSLCSLYFEVNCVLRIDLNSLTGEIVHFDRQKLNSQNADPKNKFKMKKYFLKKVISRI